jgi:hypothetical protein
MVALAAMPAAKLAAEAGGVPRVGAVRMAIRQARRADASMLAPFEKER